MDKTIGYMGAVVITLALLFGTAVASMTDNIGRLNFYIALALMGYLGIIINVANNSRRDGGESG